MGEDERWVTIEEATVLTGATKTALRARVARGTLRTVLRQGLRYIAVSDLESKGLLQPGEDVGAPATPLTTDDLLDRLERQAEELGRLRERNAQLERELAAERVLKGRRE